MKKFLTVICMSLMIILSSCGGGADSKISDYKNALQDNDLDKAVTALTSLSKETLTDDQKSEIAEINNKFFETAVANLKNEASADDIDISSLAVLTEYAIAYAAVVDKESVSSSNTQEAEEATDEWPLQPPFTVIAEVDQQDGTASYDYAHRALLKITVNKNGTYTYDEVQQSKHNSDEYWHPVLSVTSKGGKWVVDHRAIGEEYQKVYELRFNNGDAHFYIPEDGEYLWNTNYHVLDADWSDVSNLNFKTGIKIVEYTTPKGTTVIKPVAERAYNDKNPAFGPDIVGKSYSSSNGKKLSFDEEKVYLDTYNVKYTYVGNIVADNYGVHYSVSDDGKTITCLRDNTVYTLTEE